MSEDQDRTMEMSNMLKARSDEIKRLKLQTETLKTDLAGVINTKNEIRKEAFERGLDVIRLEAEKRKLELQIEELKKNKCPNAAFHELAGICTTAPVFCEGCALSAKRVADNMIASRDEKLKESNRLISEMEHDYEIARRGLSYIANSGNGAPTLVQAANDALAKMRPSGGFTCTEEIVFGCDSKTCGKPLPCPDHKEQQTEKRKGDV